MLYPPESFDWNEWFSLLSAAVVLTASFLLPKRFSPILITVFVVFTVFLSQTVDSLVAVKPFDLYDVNDSSKFEIMDVIIYYFSYPPVAYLFLYFYDKWNPKGWYCVLYVLGYALLSVLLEWVADLSRVFTYKGWRLGYSLIVYVAVYSLYLAMFHFVVKIMNREGLRPRRSDLARRGGS